MSGRHLELRRETGHIPTGRQLPRTPPISEVRRHIDFSFEDPEEACDTVKVGSRGPDASELTSVDFHVLEPRAELSGHALLKGMKGYTLTPGDLEFIRTMQENKLLQRLQRDLEEVKKLLGTEHLDAKHLLSMVKKEDVQRLLREKEAQLARLQEMMDKFAGALTGSPKNRKKREREKEITEGELKVPELMIEFTNLTLELERQERTLQSRINIKEMAAIKAEAEKVEIGARRDGKNQGKRGSKDEETAAGSVEGAKRKRPPRRRAANAKPDERSGATDAKEAAKTNPKGVKATRAAREAQREGAVQRGRGTAPTAAPQPRRWGRKAAESSSSRGQTEAAAPSAGLRRSERIANRK